MNKYQIIAKLINKKTSSYLKMTMIIFVLAFVLIISVSIFLANQFIQSRADFIDNGRLHLIEITSKRISGTGINYLNFTDNTEINTALQSSLNMGDFQILIKYHLPIGISDENGVKYDIYGLDPGTQSMLGNCKLEMDTLCSIKEKPGEINLKIPEVIIEKEGFKSDLLIDRPVDLTNGVNVKNPFGLIDNSEMNTKTVAVSKETFIKLMEIMFKVSWNDYISKQNNDSAFNLPIIDTYYVYVNKLENVEQSAQDLTQGGYNIYYPLKAFDDLNQSINTTLMICAFIGVLILGFVVLYMMISLNSFLKVQHKDLGILKQFGYDNNDLYNIYKININKIFYKLMVVIVIYNITAGTIILGIEHWDYLLLILSIFLFILIIINKIIVLVVLKKHINLGIILLLKVGKEFE